MIDKITDLQPWHLACVFGLLLVGTLCLVVVASQVYSQLLRWREQRRELEQMRIWRR